MQADGRLTDRDTSGIHGFRDFRERSAPCTIPVGSQFPSPKIASFLQAFRAMCFR